MNFVKYSPQSSSVSNSESKSKPTAKIQADPSLARMETRINNNDVPHHNRKPTCKWCRECFPIKWQMWAVTCKEASFRFCINSLETMSRTALPCILKPHQASQASPERLNFYRTSPQAPQGSLRHPPSIHQTFPKPPNRPRVSLEHSRAFPKSLMPPSFPKAFLGRSL